MDVLQVAAAGIAALALACANGASADLATETSITECGLRIEEEGGDTMLLLHPQLDTESALDGETASRDVRRARRYAIDAGGRLGAGYVFEFATGKVITIGTHVDRTPGEAGER